MYQLYGLRKIDLKNKGDRGHGYGTKIKANNF